MQDHGRGAVRSSVGEGQNAAGEYRIHEQRCCGFYGVSHQKQQALQKEAAGDSVVYGTFIEICPTGTEGKIHPRRVKTDERLEANLQNVLGAIPKIEDRLRKIPEKERWHLHIKEFRGAPIAMLCWYGYWYPDEFVELMER